MALAQRPEGGSSNSVRPGSMAERARLAKIPQPEPALKCPRCESANTKFCYFNNYSLSQPRHFCKTCRRYWTRGGALRNVPVGGGCRRNKRTKFGGGSSSKSSTTTVDRQTVATSSSSTANSASIGGAITPNIPLQPQLPFIASLHPLPDFGTPNLGLGFTGIQSLDAAVDYPVTGSSGVGLENFRLHQQIHQFPFLGGLEPPPAPPFTAPVTGLYPFAGEASSVDHSGSFAGQIHMKASGAGLITQLASVKMEENSHVLNLQRDYLGVPRNDNFWGGSSAGVSSSGGGWATDLSGFSSSSTGSLL